MFAGLAQEIVGVAGVAGKTLIVAVAVAVV